MEPMPSIAEILFGSFSRTSWNSAIAWLPRAMFSWEGAPGMYKLAYAVARYRRAIRRAGSASLACLKYSMAAADWPFLKAGTPLLRGAGAFSVLQPGAATARNRRRAHRAARRTAV